MSSTTDLRPRRGRAPSVLLLAALSAACDPGHDHPHAHAEEEPRTEAVTVHSSRHELFIEHRQLVAGVPTRFITHVTDLVTLEARSAGPVTYVLRQGSDPPLQVEVPAVARLGIYLPDLTFPAAGVWQVSLRVPWAEGTDEVRLPDRTVFATAEEAAAAPEVEGPEGVSFLKEQSWKLPLRIERVARRTLTERVRLPGRVAALPSRQAALSPPVAGLLLPPPGGSIPAPGERVRAGQVLAHIAPPLAGPELLALLTGRQQLEALRLQLATQEAEAHARASRAEAMLEQARRTLERVRDLAAQDAKPRRELEQAELEERVAAAEHAAATKLAELLGTSRAALEAGGAAAVDLRDGFPSVPLVSPLDGVVTAVEAARGEHVLPQERVLRLLDASLLQVQARTPESLLGRLGAGRTALAELPGRPGFLRPLTGEGVGRFLHTASEVDPATRTVDLVWEVMNADGSLRPGQTLEVHVETSRVEEALAVPLSALVAEDAGWIAFVQLAGETYERRAVELGVRDGAWVQVVSGLAEGEWLVTQGGLAIRLASVSSVIPAHGHAH